MIDGVNRADLLAFAHRDWDAVAEAKTDYWLRRKRGLSAAEVLAVGDELRQYALAVRPDWPNATDRDADLAVHVRVSEALRAISQPSR